MLRPINGALKLTFHSPRRKRLDNERIIQLLFFKGGLELVSIRLFLVRLTSEQLKQSTI